MPASRLLRGSKLIQDRSRQTLDKTRYQTRLIWHFRAKIFGKVDNLIEILSDEVETDIRQNPFSLCPRVTEGQDRRIWSEIRFTKFEEK